MNNHCLLSSAAPSLLDFVAERTRRRWLESASSPAWRQVHQHVLLLFPEPPDTATSRHDRVCFPKELKQLFVLRDVDKSR